MFLVKAMYRGGGQLFFRSTEEPKWKKSKNGVRLSFSLPEETDWDKWNDRPVLPLYKDDLANVTWQQEPDREREDPLTEAERIRLERERKEYEFLRWLNRREDDPPSYGEVREFLGWGQKRTRDLLLDLADRGLMRREKQGKKSLYYLTQPGNTRYAELFMEYHGEEE